MKTMFPRSFPQLLAACALATVPESYAQAPAATDASITTEAFLTFEFTLPPGMVLGPTNLGQITLRDGSVPDGAVLVTQRAAAKGEIWNKEKKAYTPQPHITKLSLVEGQKVRAVMISPVVDIKRGELAFAEITTSTFTVPKGSVGATYFDDPKSRVRIITRSDAHKSNPPLPILNACEELVFFHLVTPKGARYELSKEAIKVTVASGSGSNIEKLDTVATFEARGIKGTTEDPLFWIIAGKAPTLPQDAPRSLQVYSTVDATENPGKREGKLIARGKVPTPSSTKEAPSLGGQVIALDARLSWGR